MTASQKMSVAAIVLCMIVARADDTALTILDGNWGDANKADIQALLDEIRRHYPVKPDRPIRVHRSMDSPIVIFRASSRDPYDVKLDVENRLWAKFSYQFAHELCHIAMGYDRLKDNDGKPHSFGWLHESLCEMASLHTLRQMSVRWKTSPPYENWKSYAPSLHKYAQDLLDDPARQLPKNVTLADWYAANENVFAANATVRPLNGVVANRLLPIFEAHPAAWDALPAMPAAAGTLKEYLRAWLTAAPSKSAPAIRAFANEFGVKLP